MTDQSPARPRQVALLAGAVMVGSVIVLLLTFDRMAGIGSIETQQWASDFVSKPPGDGLGLSADDVRGILRVTYLVSGATSVAAAILGGYLLRRSAGARLALTIIAPVLVVSAWATAGFAAALVGAAVVMLWLQPSRDWFAGRTPTAPSAQTAAGSRAASSPARHPVAARPDPPALAAPERGSTSTLQAPQPRAPYAPPVQARPQSVVTACIATLVCSAVVGVALLIGLLVLMLDRASFEREVERELASSSVYDGLDASTVMVASIVMLVLFVIWAAGAAVLAILTLRGSSVARILLVVSALAAAAASLLGVMAVVPLAITATCVAVAVLLLRRDSSAWFAGR